MRNNLLVLPVAAALFLLSLAGSTYAHHATATFDMTQSATVKGAVTSFEWTNPHAYIYLDVKGEKGAIEKWSAELGALGMLARAGWRRDTLKPGDEITAIGNRAKDGKPFLHFNKIVLADGQQLSANAQ